MAADYSSQVCRQLAAMADQTGLLRPRRLTRHEAGDLLELDLTGVAPAWKARARFLIESYVGGGFAGQVYRARLEGIETADGAAVPFEVGGVYALKLFVPWSRFGRWFRNVLYGVGFQAPFGLQVNPAAVRACALWHKFIRRGAAVRLGDEGAVVDVHATFLEPRLGTMGEVLEWIDGRPWRLEVNDRLFQKKPGALGESLPTVATEYAAKRDFMRRLVSLFHEMGAPELARQYEWWTMKSQPNVLKRRQAGAGPGEGLVAVDFGAGLALLPFLPMSPGDVTLILRGLAAGRIVQFDRGDLGRLESFIAANAPHFTDLGGALAELRLAENDYHGSQLDVAHHRFRVFTDAALRRRARLGWARGYQVRGMMDEGAARWFSRRPIALVAFILAGLLPLVGRFIQHLAGSAAYRLHVGRLLTNAGYLRRAWRTRTLEMLIDWHRRGRVGPQRAMALASHPVAFWLQALTVGLLPASWHRFLTDRAYASQVIRHAIVRPLRLYFDDAFRRQWLCDMIAEGRQEGMLTDDEADGLLARVDEPFIQRYLKALAVHLCTMFISETTVAVLALYAWLFVAHSWDEAVAYAVAIFVIVNASPVSPGAFVRGIYVVYLMVRERNWRDYAVAAPLSFIKGLGYLAFPVQMVWKYPVLARFMAGRWATRAIRLVPVFGERGALLEYGVFNLFFNLPVSVRRAWQLRRDDRQRLSGPVGWAGTVLGIGHLPGPGGTVASAVAAGALAAAWYLDALAWPVCLAAAITVVAGVPLASAFERRLGRHDPGPFVLDEVAGTLIAGLAAWLPTSRWAWVTLLLAFLWFRVTDIWKPPPVRQMERLPGGWGVMADDVAAGAMALGLTVLCQLALNWITGWPGPQ